LFGKIVIAAAISLPAAVGLGSASAGSAAASTADPCGYVPGAPAIHNCFSYNSWLYIYYANGDATKVCIPANTDYPVPGDARSLSLGEPC
jgi:hypothetical protein